MQRKTKSLKSQCVLRTHCSPVKPMAAEQGIQLDWTKPGGQEQRGPLEGIARPYSRVSAQNGGGVPGVFAALPIRNKSSEISVGI